MQSKQTAVEWLENEFQEMCKDFGGLHTDFIEIFEQAKELEKQQIQDAYLDGYCETAEDSQDYYYKTYSK